MNPADPSTGFDTPGTPASPEPASSAGASSSELAADLIRQKIAALYSDEPNAAEESQEAEATPAPARSKHQQFMHNLTSSGKSPAEVQAAWHAYYQGLSDTEKREVWQEFYGSHAATHRPVPKPSPIASQPRHQPSPIAVPEPAITDTPTGPAMELPTPQTSPGVVHVSPPAAAYQPPLPTAAKPKMPKPRALPDQRSISDLKQQLLSRVNQRGNLQTKHHVQSLLFGLSMGSLVLLFLLFGFFNERFIAPLITPSKAVSNTPIIVDPNQTAAGPEQKVIIPKINVEIPVVYDEPSIEENAIQTALERGVVHYATTASPGEQGNAVIFGHSSNNILNKGKYKFAFVLLNRLESGDTFMLTKDGKRYVYRVYDKKIVKPTEVSVLNSTSRPASATLITCDPPGTSLNRLVVVGEQIAPDPAGNVASKAPQTAAATPNIIPSNAPTLWNRLTGWL